ncbi:porin family protein [Acidobacteria bacterium AH-259-D05]|nr:porin family protein [Acidobacteria bacterium AH-259-D05]
MISLKQFTGIALFAFTFLLAASQVQAQQAEVFQEQSVLITGFVGGQIFDLGDELEDAGADIDPEVFFGGRLEYRFSSHFGVEGSVAFSPVTADLLGAGLGSSATDVDTWDIHGNLVYHILPKSRIDVYVTGGLGARILDIDRGDTESYFASNFGGGVFVPLSKHFALRGDARWFVYSVDDLDTLSAAALGVAPNFDETIYDLKISGGVTFAF